MRVTKPTLDGQLAARAGAADDKGYLPLLYRRAQPGDDARLEQLLAAQSAIRVFDQLPGQLAELIKSRHPDHKYPPAELEEAVADHLAGTPPERYGVWVYYPWAGRLVHLLDEAEFVELRTNRNRYKITGAEQDRLARWRVGVVGLSVGQSIALTLAMERGCGELRLADFDLLELSNLNRIRTGVHNLGLAKVVAAAREIAEIDPFLAVTCYDEGLTGTTIDAFFSAGGPLDIVIDECDSLDVKILLRQHARARRVPVLMATSDRGLLDVERFDREPNRPLFHGLTGDLDYQALQGLTTEEKVPHILKIMGIDTISARAKASFVEVEQSLATWPQLGSAVALGGALGADVCRRIALGQYRDSGRYFVDPETIVADRTRPAPQPSVTRSTPGPLAEREMLSLINATLAHPPHGCAVPAPQQIEWLIAAAVAAPSGGNTQPWQWAATQGHLFLFHDTRRSASALDGGLGGLVALGAAVENAVLQAHRAGLAVALQYFPVAQDARLVATFCFAPARAALAGQGYEPHDHDSLAEAIARRRTNRNLGPRTSLDPLVLPLLEAAVASVPGARLHVLQSPADLDAIGELIGAGDRLRLLHPRLHQEMMDELRWTRTEVAATGDGIDLATLPLSAVDRAGMEMARDTAAMSLLREWNAGGRLKTMSQKAVAAASAVALITMPAARPIDYLLGGRAMQRAWLVATQCDLAFHPLTALPYMFKHILCDEDPALVAAMTPALHGELRDLRGRYRALFPVAGDMADIMLFRLAVAGLPAVNERRRPVRDVFRWLPA